MSVLRDGDQPLHYEDGSHRWVCPDPDGDPEAWRRRVAIHKQRHLSGRDPHSRLTIGARRSR